MTKGPGTTLEVINKANDALNSYSTDYLVKQFYKEACGSH